MVDAFPAFIHRGHQQLANEDYIKKERKEKGFLIEYIQSTSEERI